MTELLPKKGKWIFLFKKELLNEEELEFYQKNLLQLRLKFHAKVSELTDCHFYTDIGNDLLPPVDNIYASFKYNCRRHTPKCEGRWCLLWNPNLGLNRDKRNSSLDNHCATKQFKQVSKEIQRWLINACGPGYFELLDDDDLVPYCSFMENTLNYRFSENDEEFPNSSGGSLENLAQNN